VSSKSNTFWKLIKSNLRQSNSQSIPTLCEDGSFCVVDDTDIASILNNYFVDQSTLDLSQEPVVVHSGKELHSCKLMTVSVFCDKVKIILNALNTSKATGF